MNAGGLIGKLRHDTAAPPTDLIRVVRPGFILLTLAIVAAVPWIHYLNGRQYLSGYLQTLAAATEQRIEEQVIARNPEYWAYEDARLRGLLERTLPRDRVKPTKRIYDPQQRLLVSTGPYVCAPCLSHSVALRDAGVAVGNLEVAGSLRPLLIRTALMGAVAAAVGALAITLFCAFPMRAWRRAEARTRFLAEHDALTGVMNRYAADRLFERERARACRYQLPLALVMLDIDHFKQINDTYGHARGDEVLRQLASVLTSRIRASDALVRWGGEEFVIIAPSIDLGAAGQLAEKLRTAVEQADFGIPERVTISLGVAAHRPNDTLRSLAERADTALYQAKSQGRNRWAAQPAQA